ncbi:hypothetical protein RO3G_15607 [Lichtheimia corymbifera JMRC:FSU:9682]|uniref:Hyaluronan/mRNA-binding protein domain-containing protein n=1 Tax=Lichtheimia corymbifera JMRC:FSU:9682 TaxID=1263082 RepID=A0A068S3Y6_9FUNG|nr:hypothetical protein RO3G_15607 [Lichtheimia corymbifera JMRC:FSU:9682]
MSTFSSNRFDALLGGEEGETDKLGNTKPLKKSEEPPRTRREAMNRKPHTRVAVSPPSRRGRDREAGSGGGDAFDTGSQQSGGPAFSNRTDETRPRRGRKFDRHSGTGFVDSEKKINQGWGHAETAQEDAETDMPTADDPAGEGTGGGSGTATPAEPNYKTLDEYKSEEPGLEERFRRLNARPANEGTDESQWKNAVPLSRSEEDDVYFTSTKESQKKSKAKKEKVFLPIEHPPHRPAGRGGERRGGRGGRGGRGRGGRGGRGRGGREFANVNLSDANAFPTLGA